MNRAQRLALVGLAVAAYALLPHPAQAAQPARAGSEKTVDTAAVDRYVIEQLAETRIPGAAVAITRGDQVVHVQGYGQDSEGVAVTGDTPFRIASLTKSITALAVMQLVDSGRLSLGDRITALLPEFDPEDPRAERITVREVLNQTSGLSDEEYDEVKGSQPADLAGAVARLNDVQLVADPGTEWHYHNPNYEIAARVVEVISGESYADYLRAHVFAPAGMAATTATYTEDGHVDGLTDGHVAAYGLQIPVGLPGTFAAGGGDVVSTAADLAQWLIVQSNGGRSASGNRLVSSESLSQMQTSSTEAGYAFGWSIHPPEVSDSSNSSNSTRIDHSGYLLTFSAFQALLPDSGYGVAILFNSGAALLADQTAIYEGVLDIVSGADPTPPGPARPAASIDAIIGGITLVAVLGGVRGVLTARRWASGRLRGRTFARTWTALRLLPYVGVLVVVAAFPHIASWVFERAVTWTTAAYAWPALVILVLAALAAALATLVARTWRLLTLVRPAVGSGAAEVGARATP